jgi:hypothetical protein
MKTLTYILFDVALIIGAVLLSFVVGWILPIALLAISVVFFTTGLVVLLLSEIEAEEVKELEKSLKDVNRQLEELEEENHSLENSMFSSCLGLAAAVAYLVFCWELNPQTASAVAVSITLVSIHVMLRCVTRSQED